jgi:hypothetical protein
MQKVYGFVAMRRRKIRVPREGKPSWSAEGDESPAGTQKV